MELAKPLYDYMQRREAIRLKKESGERWPWSDDPILNNYKFTNVRRIDDWTTRQLIHNFYCREDNESSACDFVLNCGLFRYFGTAEFAIANGWVRVDSWDRQRTIDLAHARQDAGQPVFTGAYIVTNGGFTGDKVAMVVNKFLANLEKQSKRIANAALDTGRWETLVTELRTVPGFGGMGFMAKECALDVALTPFWSRGNKTSDGKPLDLNTYTPVGPGARRGIRWLLGHDPEKHLAEHYALAFCKKFYDVRDKYWPAGAVELELSDIQFSLCEYAKYQSAISGKRQKRLYTPRDPVAAGLPVRSPRGTSTAARAAIYRIDDDLEMLLEDKEKF